MNWVVVTLDDDELRVLGMFDSEAAGDAYILDAFGSSMLLEHFAVRPILAARPIA